jgi:hypothetical protein
MRKLLCAALMCALSTCAAAPVSATESFPNPTKVMVFCLSAEGAKDWALSWEDDNYVAANEVLMRKDCFLWRDVYGAYKSITWTGHSFVNAELLIVSFNLPDQRTGYSYLITQNGV